MFDVTIKGLTTKQLTDVIAALPKATWIQVTPTDTGGKTWKTNGKGTGRVEPDALICLNPKADKPNPGTQAAIIVNCLEKLESHYGVGNVSREELTEAASKKAGKPMGAAITGALAKELIKPL